MYGVLEVANIANAISISQRAQNPRGSISGSGPNENIINGNHQFFPRFS